MCIGPSFETRFREAIKEIAIQEHDRGMLIFACAPNLTVDKATELFKKSFYSASGRWCAKQMRKPQRQRVKTKNARGKPLEQKISIDEVQEWLKTISAFEDDFKDKGVVKSELFSKYRQLFDGLRLTNKIRIV
jgi:hypothetical protein